MFFRIALLLPGVLAFFSALPAQVIPVSQARKMDAGSTVTVQGIITNGKEFGKTRFLQDGTAGIAIYPDQSSPAGAGRAEPGDSVEVSGVLKIYNELLEISPVTAYKLLASNRPLPLPALITLAEIGPAYEGQVVQIDSLRFTDQKSLFTNGTSPVVDNMGHKSQIFLHSGSALIGTPVPKQPTSLVAIVSRYNNFQLLPLINTDASRSAPPKNNIYLAANTVTTTLIVKGCKSGKITVKNAAGYEVLFNLAHGSGTTLIDVEKLPAGAYGVVVQSGAHLTALAFEKI